MREVITRSWCDRCHHEGRPGVEASTSPTLTVDNNGPLELDLCEACGKELLNELVLLLDEYGIPPAGAPARSKAAPRYHPDTRPGWTCPLCQAVVRTGSAVGHLASQHHLPKPEQPTHCPDCERVYVDGHRMLSHRVRAHGYDPRAAMLASQPVPPGKRAARASQTQLACPVCGRLAQGGQGLSSHVRAVHGPDEWQRVKATL